MIPFRREWAESSSGLRPGSGRAKRKTKDFADAQSGLARLQGTVEKALDEAGIGAGEVAAIGVGSPGPVDPHKGVLLSPPNLGADDVRIGPAFGDFGGVSQHVRSLAAHSGYRPRAFRLR